MPDQHRLSKSMLPVTHAVRDTGQDLSTDIKGCEHQELKALLTDMVHHTAAKRLLPLGYLAPDIIEAILDGQQPVDLNNGYKLSILWSEQRALLGFLAHT